MAYFKRRVWMRVEELEPPSWRAADCSRTKRFLPLGEMLMPSKPWLFWRPWVGSTGFGCLLLS